MKLDTMNLIFFLQQKNHYPKIVGWNNDGSVIEIRHPKNFEQVVLPTLYKHSKMPSFTKQVNLLFPTLSLISLMEL